MGQSAYKITVEDGTTLEVKVDKANIATYGIIHIFHGMAEHMDRYETLVNALTHQGYDVIRHNHRGHGKEIDEKERGHYDSMNQVVQGHSMGSIIARLFVETYPNFANGLILTGTGQYPKWKGIPARISLKLISIFTGKRNRLKWVNQLVYKSFNKKIDQPRTESDWLSSQSTEVDKFVNDEYTGFLVSNQLIYETVKHMTRTANYTQLKKMNKQLPILMISGKNDPFGEYGRGVKSLARNFMQIEDMKYYLKLINK